MNNNNNNNNNKNKNNSNDSNVYLLGVYEITKEKLKSVFV